MALSGHIKDNEANKFKECNGETTVNTSICQGDGDSLNVGNFTSVKIYEVSTTANTKASQLLSNNTKAISIKCRTISRLKFNFVEADIDADVRFFTIGLGGYYERDNLNFSGKTIYFKTSVATTVEIIEYT